jgi:hypothetical protein
MSCHGISTIGIEGNPSHAEQANHFNPEMRRQAKRTHPNERSREIVEEAKNFMRTINCFLDYGDSQIHEKIEELVGVSLIHFILYSLVLFPLLYQFLVTLTLLYIK